MHINHLQYDPFIVSYNLFLKQWPDNNLFKNSLFYGLNTLPLKSVKAFEFAESGFRPVCCKQDLADWIKIFFLKSSLTFIAFKHSTKTFK